jgi:2-succinyl-5-enolpyruvyl-6-hydroxy-3-cyclohexene-1-carboxylate synthase
VIAFGGQVVSKRVKGFLYAAHVDMISVTGDVMEAVEGLLEGVPPAGEGSANQYLECWLDLSSRVIPRSLRFLESAPMSNLSATHRLLANLPPGVILHLGNSAAIRYAQLIPLEGTFRCYSNRGTSGIDGCVSTAVGAAMVSEELHVLLVGDLSFVYDSNALWNKDFPSNLKIVILNDGGGGIFRLLEGPDRMEFFEEFSVTHHPVSLELISQAFGHRFMRVERLEDLEEHLELLFRPEKGFTVLEVDTSGSENSRIFEDYLKSNS